MAKITLKDLSHSYLKTQSSNADWAVRDVNIDWNDGGAYALLGPSGCGKTTLLNIISGLIIFVKEKNKDIGILKTIGMSNKSIIKIFFTIGISIGLIGSLIGLIIGILFTINIKSIQSFLEYLLGTKLFSEEVYYLSSLPSQISINEVIYVLFVAIIISIISTIFPALSSARIDPVKSLRSE